MVQVERKVNRKTRTGVVVSDVNDQTVIVAVERATRHRLYHKVIRRTKRYPVHDPENRATTGDLVVIEECRPISKTKRWRLVDVVTEREVAEVAPETIGETFVDEVQRSAARAAAEEAATETAAPATTEAEPPEAEEPAAEEAPEEAATETAAPATTEAEPPEAEEPAAEEAPDEAATETAAPATAEAEPPEAEEPAADEAERAEQ